jgi:Rrf2 family protein
MFKVSRKSEYALMAVQYLGRQPRDAIISVAELSVAESIPQDILAKVLQGLKRAGVLTATKGAGGGYRLARSVAEIRFLDVVRPFEEQLAVVNCQSSAPDCDRHDCCSLRDPMTTLNAFVLRQFETLTMEMFVTPPPWLQQTVRTQPMGGSQPHVSGLSLSRRLG